MNSRIYLLAILLVLHSFIATAQGLPNVRVEDSTGKMFQTSNLIDGKNVIVVSFWSSTCKYCIEEIDALSEVLSEFPDVSCKVACVSVDDSRSISRARAMVKSHDWDDFTLLYDRNRDLYRSLNVVYIPQLFIYDKNGKQLYSHTGYSAGDELEIIKVIQQNQ